jgi:hypothetical protein
MPLVIPSDKGVATLIGVSLQAISPAVGRGTMARRQQAAVGSLCCWESRWGDDSRSPATGPRRWGDQSE